ATENIVNLTTCPLITSLFLNYSIDGVSNSFTGDWATSNNPFLNGYGLSTPMIACDKGGMGIQYYPGLNHAGTYTGIAAGISGLFVNGGYKNLDQTKQGTCTFTRYDLLKGGLMEGSLDVYYLEGSTSHHLVANFRVKRIT